MVEVHDARPSSRPQLPVELLSDTLAICRLEPAAPVPSWAAGPSPFLTLSRTAEELSITALQSAVPIGVACERDYRAVRVRGPLPLNLVSILAAIADPLAAAGMSIFAISTYDTDYVLVKAGELEAALQVLQQAGHRITRTSAMGVPNDECYWLLDRSPEPLMILVAGPYRSGTGDDPRSLSFGQGTSRLSANGSPSHWSRWRAHAEWATLLSRRSFTRSRSGC
jgi:uncharacterized protein